ncbi:MAG: FAD-binding oxidoreductase [Armatimonadota bacterium]|nr:FAD-binding oxidoreductase [Armatimonadota bacterium]
MDEVEVLIVGAGVVGVCTALEMLREGRGVLVVERREIGAGASGNNAGSCAVQNKLPPFVAIAREAVAIWQALQQELEHDGLDLGYVRTGGLRLAETPEEVKELRQSYRVQRALGAPVTFMSGDEARAVAPYLGPGIVAANWCPEDGFCDVLQAMRVLATTVRRRGGTIWTHTEVSAITRDRTGFRVQTSRGPVRAGRVVVAAGLWARDLATTLGAPVPLRPKINILSVTPRVAPVMHHMITHASHRLTMKQLQVGTVVIGGGWQGEGDYRSYRVWPTFPHLMGNWQLAVRAVPALADLNILRAWAGIDGRSPDNLPLVGPVPGLPGAYLMACCPGGWTMGPFMARMLAEMIRTRRTPRAVEPFGLHRFVETGRGA